jgi:hypothetical protein
MKKNNVRVIQINGLRGLLLTLFIISCLVAGFIVFPAFLTMNAWNFFAIKSTSLPQLNFQQGLLLWAIIAFGAFIFSKRKFIVSFGAEQELSESQVQRIVSKVKEINNPAQQDDLNPETQETKEAKIDK